jgi:hypothetical protein
MADYHPLIARAVAGLEKNSGENRRALYERARTALVAQLRGVTPALEESEITRERLALEEAIRRVEAEAARHARDTARPNLLKRAEAARREEPSRPAPAPRPDEPPPRPTLPGFNLPSPPPRAPAEPRPSASRRALANAALREFRQGSSDTQSWQSGRRVEGFDNPLPEPPSAAPEPETLPEPPEYYERREPQPPQPENLWALPLDGSQQAAPVDFDQQAPPHPSEEPPEEEEEAQPYIERAPRSYRGLIWSGLIVILVLGLGSLVYWQRGAIGDIASSIAMMIRPSTAPAPRETAPAQPKITDRVGQPAAEPSGGVGVAQRVVLYEEDPQDSQGKRYIGSVIWRTETKPGASGRPPELVVRGDINVPERNMTATWMLRRNTDQSLPASHTIEIMFNLPADSSTGGVQNVPGVLMKQAEQTRGTPLAGLAVKVTPGYFLIGLSALETDMQRNLQLLKERAWFDIPVVYNNNRRAILAMEKGTPGERVFAEAFKVWKQ